MTVQENKVQHWVEGNNQDFYAGGFIWVKKSSDTVPELDFMINKINKDTVCHNMA